MPYQCSQYQIGDQLSVAIDIDKNTIGIGKYQNSHIYQYTSIL